MKKYFGIICLLALSLSVQGQQVSRVSNYLYNQLYFNPAASGMYEQQLNVGMFNKFQWAGFTGAPMLSALWVDYKTNQKGLSFGGVVEHFKFGVSKRMGISANPTYSVLL